MSIDPVKVALAVQGGMSAVCATCQHHWEAQDRGEDSCGKDCGGPLAGKDFPAYLGPLPSFERWCFRCGGDSIAVVRAGGRRDVGVCKDHIEWLGYSLASSPGVAVRTGGGLVAPEALILPRPKTLAQAIFEVESHFAKKDEE
jgi:hypothetical protein